MRLVLPPVFLIVLLIGALQLLSGAGVIRHFILPAPSDIAVSLLKDTPAMSGHILHTFRIAFRGYALSMAAGVASALLMDRFTLISRTFYPLIVISQTIPTLVITPVIVLVFGYSDIARLFVVVLVCFFPVTISFLQGLRGVDPDLLRMMQTMGASKVDIMRHVKIPAALPSLFAGLRISSTYCVMAAVLAEWAGGGDGLGIYMLRAKRSFRFDVMFASIIWIVALSLVFYASAVLSEQLGLPWKRRTRRRTGHS